MSFRIFVGNLSYEVLDQDLEAAFSPFGALSFFRVIMDRETGRSRGFGFVEFEEEAAGAKALAELDGTRLKDRELRLKQAEDRPAPARRSFDRPDGDRGRGRDAGPPDSRRDFGDRGPGGRGAPSRDSGGRGVGSRGAGDRDFEARDAGGRGDGPRRGPPAGMSPDDSGKPGASTRKRLSPKKEDPEKRRTSAPGAATGRPAEKQKGGAKNRFRGYHDEEEDEDLDLFGKYHDDEDDFDLSDIDGVEIAGDEDENNGIELPFDDGKDK